MNRPRRRLSLGIGIPDAVYSVCKLVDTTKGSPGHLSVDAFVYEHTSNLASIVAVTLRNLSVQRIERRFCGPGPDDFEEVVKESKKNLSEFRTPRTLICQEGFKDLRDATYFITSHLWADPNLERYEAMGAREDVSEIVYACFGVRL